MLDFIENTDELVTELSNEDLMIFLYEYNKYIKNFDNEHDEGCTPVCMEEFFNMDFQYIVRENYKKEV